MASTKSLRDYHRPLQCAQAVMRYVGKASPRKYACKHFIRYQKGIATAEALRITLPEHYGINNFSIISLPPR